MASLVRIALRNIAGPLSNPTLGKHDIKIVRTITGKLLKESRPDHKPKPWPYKEKKYTFFHQLVDRTTSRFDENSKVRIVEKYGTMNYSSKFSRSLWWKVLLLQAKVHLQNN